ncbi:unnamed protein product [Aspergillus oryzae RIB40]|uniref:DNA, SC023 n=1 Tax=Aspergillus oryzae (strain ATCC 42149 / RIB 40) TaxID=510516 RepID=Q2UHC9_ASPOR|nr:unnamed protein product [Aspergillus oryzae RIB40]KOC10489.1 hypothetical protein AFLA70_400g000690 [Aspergillus flavus AF70]BAE59036.1 unnamed protein product [Aspergillus oryzae RIB40]
MHEAILLHLSSSYCSSLQSGTRPMYANNLFHFQSRILPYKLQYPRRQLILVPLFVEGSLQSLHSAGLERDSGIHPHVAENVETVGKEDDHYLQQFTANPGRSQPKFVATNNEYRETAWTKKLTLL